MSKKVIIVLEEKTPDGKHRCNSEGCPFYSTGQKRNSVCYALWSTPPIGKNSLASLCNYYDTTNLHIIESTTDEKLNKRLDKIINKKQYKNVIYFIERFCYIKDKKGNKQPIKLTNLQKRFINHLNKLKKVK